MLRSALREISIPLLSVVSALAVGAIAILLITGKPEAILLAYQGLIEGAFLKPRGLVETLVKTTPYIYTGLAVAVGFRAGLFNIGAEGQFLVGSLASVWVGYSVTGLPFIVHLPLALLAGALAGALWGAIPGLLKAKVGAHEVINTIMMNYIAAYLVQYLVIGPMRTTVPGKQQTPDVLPTAQIPPIFDPSIRLHWGFVLSIIAAIVVWWFLFKTTVGFELRTVGASPTAARYAGMSVVRLTVLAMALSGALAGLAGADEILGLSHSVPILFQPGYGFTAIAVALLAKNHPLAVLPAAFLFGAMANGASLMELRSQMPRYGIDIIQALVLLFVAAPSIVRWVFRIRRPVVIAEAPLTRGWGG